LSGPAFAISPPSLTSRAPLYLIELATAHIMDDKQETPDDQHVEQNLAQEAETTPAPGNETLHHEESSVVAEKGLDAEGLENEPAENLTPEHREYLLSRHKTVDLDPLPTMDPADPLNWPSWKVLSLPQRIEQS
jgi:hypothetical protein